MKELISKNKIIEKLSSLFHDRMQISIEKAGMNENLLGGKCNLYPRDLIYLYYFIQEEFEIEIDKKYILDGSFSTINNIADIIYESLQAKEVAMVI